ncbi:MAG TPA: hypothetical protein VL126_01405 [Bacteroidota bacterium]|nr:hypothetical protein [Bacteroidota bacterium]
MRKEVFIISLLCIARAWGENQSYVRERDGQFVIGNRYVERVISLSPGRDEKSKIVNKLTGESYRLQDNIFELHIVFSGLGPAPGKEQNGENGVVLTARDFQFLGSNVRELGSGGQELCLNFRFEWGLANLALKAIFGIDSARYSLRKWIELSDSLDGVQFLDRIYVESMMIPRHHFAGGSLGQPLLGDDIFLGVEYPTVESDAQSHLVRMGYVCGQVITHTPYRSHSSIIGCASSRSRMVDAFMEYVEGIKVNGTHPYLLYNSWYDLRNPAIAQDSLGIMNEARVLGTLDAFRSSLYDRYGVGLDAFVLDDGWDSYENVWGIDSARFPRGFSEIAKVAGHTHTALGLWASPFGGYSNRDRRVKWANDHGYETSGNFLCLAGVRYQGFFQQSMLDYEKKFGVGYFKWDGILLSCSEANHGHPQGIYSREAEVDAYIDIMKAVRRTEPNVFLNVTTGAWLSPWWLQYADCMWMQGEDYAYEEHAPSLNDRQKSITYKDVILWDDLRKLDLHFPMSNLMTHGVIKGRYNLLGGANESLSSFCDEAMMYFGRGVMMWELYVSPDVLSVGEWNALASSIRWAKANQDVLKKTKMVLGDPHSGEAYGFLHMTRPKGILLLRNPGPLERAIRMKLTSDLVDLDPSTRYYVKVIYPYNLILPAPVGLGGLLSFRLDGYEVLTAELIPAKDIDKSLPVGVKYSAESGDLIVLGRRGETKTIQSVEKRRLGQMRLGKPVQTLSFDSRSHQSTDGIEWTGLLDISVPEDYGTSKVAFLLESKRKLNDQEMPAFKVTVNGHPKDPAVEAGDGTWFWVTADLDNGSNKVECSIHFAEKGKEKVSFWLTGERELSSQRIGRRAMGKEQALPAKPYPASVERVFMPLSHWTIQ